MSISTVLRCVLALCFLCVDARAGYYFTWLQAPEGPELRDCVDEMRRVVEARRNKLAGPEGDGPPLLGILQLEFNGIDEGAYEPFVFPGAVKPIEGDRRPAGFNSCKTDGKAYDDVVTACLLIARDHFPPTALKISSDVGWSGTGWQAGAMLYTSVLGRAANDPISDKAPPRPEEATDWPIDPFYLVAGGVLVIVFFAKGGARLLRWS